MESIKLTILIPTYNFKLGINKILDCIESIEDDLRDYIEIIISDDSEEEIIQKSRNKSLKKHFKNYFYFHNIENEGAINNWNKLISKAKGDYIWLLHHDEYWQKEKNIIRYILEAINTKNPNILILPITKLKTKRIFNINFKIIQKHITFKKIIKTYINNPKLFIKSNIIGPPSALIYKKNNFSYDVNLKYLVDVEFYIRLFKSYNSKKIILGTKYFDLISMQDNDKSITSFLQKEIRSLKKKEENYIFNRYNLKFNLFEKTLSLYSYIILKLYSICKTKIKIEN